MFNSDVPADNSFYYGLVSPIDFEYQGAHNEGSGKVLLDDVKFVWRMLPGGATFEHDNWIDLLSIDQYGNGFIKNKRIQTNVSSIAALSNGIYAVASYPDNTWTATNTYVVAVRAIVGGVQKQLNNVSINFTAANISCTLPESATECTLILQRI
ncbi:hypothetical protein D3C87_1040800 [compost metagenome]